MKNKIKQLLVDTITGTHIYNATEELPIENFAVNGEMALVDWYRQGNEEINGKYVISKIYYD